MKHTKIQDGIIIRDEINGDIYELSVSVDEPVSSPPSISISP